MVGQGQCGVNYSPVICDYAFILPFWNVFGSNRTIGADCFVTFSFCHDFNSKLQTTGQFHAKMFISKLVTLPLF